MKENISKKQLREFGFIFGFGFAFLFGFLTPVISGNGLKLWTLFVGALVLILGLSAPRLLHYPYKGWMKLGNALGWINSHIIFGLIFIFILQPIAFAMRLVGYDPLRRRRKGEITYRENRNDHFIDLTRIF